MPIARDKQHILVVDVGADDGSLVHGQMDGGLEKVHEHTVKREDVDEGDGWVEMDMDVSIFL